MKENKKYQDFCKLIKKRKTLDEIVNELKISERTYYNYLKEFRRQLDDKYEHVPFNMAKYFKLVMNGYYDKDELAESLGVTKMTLIKYEKEILPDFSKYLLLNDVYIHDISKILHIRQKDAKSYLEGFFELSTILKQIEAIKEYATFNPSDKKESKQLDKMFSDVCFILEDIMDEIEENKNTFYTKYGIFG